MTTELIENKEQRLTPEPKIADELKNMKAEPLLPVEVKLVTWSLVSGVVLLGILVVLSRWLFPNP
jgi:hypothetical protein